MDYLNTYKRLLALADAGLFYGKDAFDQERYQELRELTLQLVSTTGHEAAVLPDLEKILTKEEGYPTPKVDVRGLIKKENRFLLVEDLRTKEWSLPGGYAEIGCSPKENIEKEGATVTIEEVNYDECVRMANKMAEETENGVMVQDTAWDGYEKIPTWIMQGYGTMALEASQQLRKFGSERPSHVFVQAGVGSLAGAVIGYFANAFPENPPIMVVVEAQAADCLYQSAIKKDGEIRFVDGDLQTIMAGLACGEPNTISFDILKNHTSFFVSAPDWVSEKGMRMLGAPLKGDPQVVSGESGAVAMGLVATVMQDPDYQELREALQLDETSNVLMFSTEGDTDPDNYKKILWR